MSLSGFKTTINVTIAQNQIKTMEILSFSSAKLNLLSV